MVLPPDCSVDGGSGLGQVNAVKSRVVRVDPVCINDLTHREFRGKPVQPDHSISRLIPVVDPRFLIAERNAFKAG